MTWFLCKLRHVMLGSLHSTAKNWPNLASDRPPDPSSGATLRFTFRQASGYFTTKQWVHRPLAPPWARHASATHPESARLPDQRCDGLEKSLAQNSPRALVDMATGAGKTFTAVTAVCPPTQVQRCQALLVPGRCSLACKRQRAAEAARTGKTNRRRRPWMNARAAPQTAAGDFRIAAPSKPRPASRVSAVAGSGTGAAAQLMAVSIGSPKLSMYKSW